MLEFLIDRVTPPIGELIVVADGDGNLRTIDWTDHETRMKQRYTLSHLAYDVQAQSGVTERCFGRCLAWACASGPSPDSTWGTSTPMPASCACA